MAIASHSPQLKNVMTPRRKVSFLPYVLSIILLYIGFNLSLSAYGSNINVHAATVNNTRILMGFGSNKYGQLGLEDPTTLWSFDATKYLKDRSAKVLRSCVVNHDFTNDNESYIGSTDTHPVNFDPFPFHGILIDTMLNVYTWGHGSHAHGTGDRLMSHTNYPFQYLVNINSLKLAGELLNDTSVLSLACGRAHTLIITGLNRVIVFGSQQNGQLGIGDNATYVYSNHVVQPQRAVGLESYNFVNAWAVGNRTFAVDDQGDSYAFGDNSLGQLCSGNTTANRYTTPVDVLNTFGADKTIQKVTGGNRYTIILTTTGKLYGCGSDTNGLTLGLNQASTYQYYSPQELLPGETIKHVSSMGSTTVAVSSSDQFYFWGQNLNNQIGNASSVRTPTTFMGVTLSASQHITQLSLGRFSLSVVTVDSADYLNEIWVVGNNTFGSLGVLNSHDSLPPAFLSSWTKLSSQTFPNGTTIQSLDSNLFVLTSDQQLHVQGDVSRLPGPQTNVLSPTVINVYSDESEEMMIEKIAAGFSVSGAIASVSGKLFLWGAQRYPNAFLTKGESKLHVFAPKEFNGLKGVNVTSIAFGTTDGTATSHSAAVSYPFSPTTFFVLYNDSSQAGSWGSNQQYQLGYQYSNGTYAPVYDIGSILTRNRKIREYAVSGRHTFALGQETTDTNVYEMYVCGDGRVGQLGAGPSLIERSTLLQTQSAKKIAVGDWHSLYVDNTNTAWGAGDNTDGRAGFVVALYSSQWMPISLGAVSKVFAGTKCSFFLLQDGTLWASGSNVDGQLGLGNTTTTVKTPTQVTGLTGSVLYVSTATGGGAHTLILMTDGRVYVSGRNDKGQLGLGDTTTRYSFVELAIPDDHLGLDVAAGFDHSLILVGKRACPNACIGGSCDYVQGVCSCQQGYSGTECQLFNCYGLLSNSSQICSGNGECVSPDKCKCTSGYTGWNCEMATCFGFNASDPRVCSSHGSCVQPDTCQCPSSYSGNDCSVPICFGKLAIDSLVCSGNGQCIAPDTCQCNSSDITTFDCKKLPVDECGGWMSSEIFGAPRPSVSAQWNSESLQFFISMTNKRLPPSMRHLITYEAPPFNGENLFQNSTVSIGELIATSNCTNGYRVVIPWTSSQLKREYLSDSSGDQILKIWATLYMHYVNDEKRTVVSFHASQAIYAQLSSHTFTVFNTTSNQAQELIKLSVQSVYPREGDQVIVIGSELSILMSGYTLSSIYLKYSSLGADKFDVSFTLSPFSSPSAMVYNVKLISRENLSSFSGSFVLLASLTNHTATSNYSIPFEVSYEIILPNPPLNLAYATDIILSNSFNGIEKREFSSGDQVFVSTSLTSQSGPVLSNDQLLRVHNVFVCCMKSGYTGGMPEFNPSQNRPGCTVYDSQSMSRWFQLVNKGVPNSSTSTTIISAGQKSSIFSFDVNALVDVESRTCYLHVNTIVNPRFQLNNAARNLHQENMVNNNEQSHSFSFLKIAAGNFKGDASLAHNSLKPMRILMIVALVFTTIVSLMM